MTLIGHSPFNSTKIIWNFNALISLSPTLVIQEIANNICSFNFTLYQNEYIYQKHF